MQHEREREREALHSHATSPLSVKILSYTLNK
jgi:hypothetical protein